MSDNQPETNKQATDGGFLDLDRLAPFREFLSEEEIKAQLERLCEELQRRHDEMGTDIKSGNMERLYHNAHSMCGTSGTFGAIRLDKASAVLEAHCTKDAKGADMAKLEELVEDVRACIRSTIAAYDDFIKNL